MDSSKELTKMKTDFQGAEAMISYNEYYYIISKHRKFAFHHHWVALGHLSFHDNLINALSVYVYSRWNVVIETVYQQNLMNIYIFWNICILAVYKLLYAHYADTVSGRRLRRLKPFAVAHKINKTVITFY